MMEHGGALNLRPLLLLLTLTTALHAAAVEERSVRLCRPASCTSDNCIQTRCAHGQCSVEGLCVCLPCWTGPACDKYKNEYFPTFDRRAYVANASHVTSGLAPSTPSHTPFISVHATDKDIQLTCHQAGSAPSLPGSASLTPDNACDCGAIVYAIESGNERGWFVIDPATGEISLAAGRLMGAAERNRSHVLYVTAVNAEVGGLGGDLVGPKNYATVTVLTGGVPWGQRGVSGGVEGAGGYMEEEGADWGVEEEHHSRRKRAISQVSNITFALIKTGVYNYTTVMYVGSKIHFQLQIQFPPGVSDLLVELFTPDNASTVMVICEPSITWVGANIAFNASSIVPTMDSIDGTNNWDHATLNFGNVTNTNTFNGYNNQSMIMVEWDAVMIDDAATVNGSMYWVSAGAEYNSANDIWIGQAGFTTILDNYNVSAATPTFNMSGPASVQLGTTSVFEVDMYIPYPVADLVFEGFTPLNNSDVMSACGALVTGTGANYACFNYSAIVSQTSLSATGLTNDRVALNIGHAINKGSREVTPWADNRITVQFALYTPYNASLIGQTVYVGGTVEIGTSQIWAGQLGVTIIDTVPSDLLTSPVFTRTVLNNVSANEPAVVEFNMTTVVNSDTVYTLTAVVPSGFKICSVRINYQGVNVPCAVPSLPVYTSSLSNGINDHVSWVLGRIRNTGMRPASIDPQANTVQIYVTVQPLTVASGLNLVQLNMAWGLGSSNSPGSAGVLIVTATTAMQPSATNGITAALMPEYGSNVAYVNASTDLRLKVATHRGVIYTPFSITFTLPTAAGVNVLSLCRVAVVWVGANMPCVIQSIANSSVTYLALSNGTSPYQASVPLGVVCNIGPMINGTYNQSSVDDVMELSAIVRVEDSAALTNGSLAQVAAVVQYAAALSWYGSYNLTTYRAYQVTYTNATPFIQVPRLGVNNITSNASITLAAPGSVVSFQVFIKVPPQSVADWSITADVTSDPYLSVCSINIVQFGYAIPCLNTSIVQRETPRPGNTGVQLAWLELYKLSNVGNNTLYADNIYDNNSLVLQVVVAVLGTVPLNSLHGVALSVDYGMNGVDAFSNMSVQIGSTATTLAVVPGVPMPNLTLYQTAVNPNATVSSQLYPGDTIILTAGLDVPPGADLNVGLRLVTSPPGQLDMNQANVVWVGRNIPCLRKQWITANITSATAGSICGDIASVNLGQVCQFAVDNTAPMPNTILFEVIATLVRNTTGVPINVQAIMTINGTDQTPQTLPFTFYPAIPLQEYPNLGTMSQAAITLNVTNGTVVQLAPADVYSLYVDVTPPPNSSVFGLVDVVAPVYASAFATIMSIHVVSFGRNLGSVQALTDIFKVVLNSTQGTSQTDTAYIDLSKLTSTGHTYRAGTYQPGDDTLRLQVTLQLADAAVAAALVPFAVSFGAKVGTPILFSNLSVETVRTPGDAPNLQLTTSLNQLPIYNAGQTLALNGLLQHINNTNTSRAECYNVTVVVLLPPYMTVYASLATNFTGAPHPTLANLSTGANGFTINLPHLYFTDIVNFTVVLSLFAPVVGGSGQAELYEVSFEPIVNIIWRPSSLITAGTDITQGLSAFNLTISTASTGQCTSTRQGATCPLIGSVSPAGYEPLHGSPGGSGWQVAQRLGLFNPYVQVYLGNLTQITAVILTNKGSSSLLVTSFQLQFSNDGINWVNGATQFPAPFIPSSIPSGSSSPAATIRQSTLIGQNSRNVGTIAGTMLQAALFRGAFIPTIAMTLATPSYATTAQTYFVTSPVPYAYARFVVLTQTAPGLPQLTVEFDGCVTALATGTNTWGACPAMRGWLPALTRQADYYPRGFMYAAATGTLYFSDTNPVTNVSQAFMSSTANTFTALDGRVGAVVGYLPSVPELYAVATDTATLLASEDGGMSWSSVSPQRLAWAKAQPGYLPWTTVLWEQLSSGTTLANGVWQASYYGLFGPNSPTIEAADWMSCCA